MNSKKNPRLQNHVSHLSSLTSRIEEDPNHHLAGPFLPQTPLGSLTPGRSISPAFTKGNLSTGNTVSPWLRWAVQPASSFKLLLLPIVLYVNWELVSPYIQPGVPNPFRFLFFLSGRIPSSPAERPLYAKTYQDLLFVAYNVVFYSLIRQLITVNICHPIGRYFGIRRGSKLDRFGEQGYALVYFTLFGAWGLRIMGQLPTWWYRTEFFWIDYPHWGMTPELKRYYLMHTSYWCQQLLVLLLGLEKPRKDYAELVAHHFVTLWLIGWSYFINLTLIGNAVHMSMDIPDAFLASTKLMHYIQWHNVKNYTFALFILVWTYFRHYLNLKILWSVWYEFDLIPESSKVWRVADGTYLVHWMRYQVFLPLALLQLLNLFWYYLMMRILVRAVITKNVEDERSDDEDEGGDTKED